MIKKLIFLTGIILSLITLQAKSGKKTSGNLPLLNTKWILEKIDDSYIFFHDTDTAYIVFYDNYKFAGNFSCNIFFGEFSYGKKRIKLDYVGATKKLCQDMDIEERFFKTIKNDITHYYVAKNNLYLLYKLKVVCKFRGIVVSD